MNTSPQAAPLLNEMDLTGTPFNHYQMEWSVMNAQAAKI